MSTWAQATTRACQRVPERSRCVPTAEHCPQAGRCAVRERPGPEIDASVSIRALGFCPMFVDNRASSNGTPRAQAHLGEVA